MQLVLMMVVGLVVNSQDTSKFAQPSLHGGFKPSDFQFLLASSSKTSKLLSKPSKQREVKVVKKPSTSAFTTPSIDNEISYFDLESGASEVKPVFVAPTASNFKVRVPRQGASVPQSVPGGVDFSQATRTEDGRLCVIKEESVETVSKDPILECTHKNVEKCHYTYITYFKAAQEEKCEENFEKKCQIVFKQEAIPETVRKCWQVCW